MIDAGAGLAMARQQMSDLGLKLKEPQNDTGEFNLGIQYNFGI
jgi:hypothetical protein